MIDILEVAGGCEDTDQLVKEFDFLRESKAKVYYTFLRLEDEDATYTFVTTSKDVHLALGRLSHKGRQNLMAIILRAFDIEGCATGLLTPRGEGGSLLVTLIGGDNATTVQLSPAR